MKTIPELKKEISDLEEKGKSKSLFTPNEYKKMGKECEFLRSCLLYLETNPREDFLKSSLNSLLEKKQKIKDGFVEYQKYRPYDGKNESGQKAEYNSLMQVTTLYSQIRTLQYILQ